MASERQAYDPNTPWWGEHVHRYDVAIQTIAAQKTQPTSILDIACGNGFGSDMLAKNYPQAQVIGGDLDPQAIKDCQLYWSGSNLDFQVLDGTQLPFQDQSIDVICSFETIEHTTQYHQMISEFSRVLNPSGIAFISTPNFLINSPSGVVTNPYHTQEFVLDELDDILKKHFKKVMIFGQSYARYKNKPNPLGSMVEKLLYQRGIRKTPLKMQDNIMQLVNKSPMYPLASDFEMAKDVKEMVKCKTFFAICSND